MTRRQYKQLGIALPISRLALSAVFLLPFFWMLSSSFKRSIPFRVSAQPPPDGDADGRARKPHACETRRVHPAAGREADSGACSRLNVPAKCRSKQRRVGPQWVKTENVKILRRVRFRGRTITMPDGQPFSRYLFNKQ